VDFGCWLGCGLWFKYFGGQMVVWQGGSPTHSELTFTLRDLPWLIFASSITGSCTAPYIVNLSGFLLIHFKIISNNSA
jgi:hypothetical protein